MTKSPALSSEEMLAFLQTEFPQVFNEDATVTVDHLVWGEAHTIMKVDETNLRPGGTVSGPTLMMLADCTAYICVLSIIGKVALAVTTNLNINFLRKPPKADLLCEARPLKVGKSLIVIEADLYGANDPEKKLVAHSTLTYSIPPK